LHYGHSQALLPGPFPTYSYEPLAMYHPMQNQWRSNQALQSSNQTTQPEASNNNPHNSQAKQENSPPSTLVMNINAIILGR
jgi:hypothetical protein